MKGLHTPVALLPSLIPGTATALWRELPGALLVNAVWAVSLVPLTASTILGAPWWLLMATILPPALVGTGLAAVADDIRLGKRVRVAKVLALDPVLALLATLVCATSGWLVAAGGWASGVGYVLAGLALLTLPMSYGYGALRGTSGIDAIRGGLVIAIQQPGGALSIFALTVLAAFAVAATAGVLVLVLPLAIGLLTSQGVAVAVDRFEELTGRKEAA